jgi:hypothetical protein
MNRTFRAISSVAAVVSLAACAESSPTGITADAALSRNGGASTTDVRTEVKLEIRLTRPTDAVFPTATGDAKFESKGSERQLEIEVEHIPAGTEVTFSLGGNAIGTAKANALGEASLKLSTKRGQTVPSTVAGLAVAVSSADGPIVSGSF